MIDIQVGARGVIVHFVQERLNAVGFGPVPLTGVLDDDTVAAILRMQAGRSLPTTGVVDGPTWDSLLSAQFGADEGPEFFGEGDAEVDSGLDPSLPDLAPGDRGDAVRDMQLRLRALGIDSPADGVYGDATAAAVRAFQDSRFIAATGLADSNTRLSLAGATFDAPPLWTFADSAELQDQAGPDFFGSTVFRDVEGTGGYYYRQYDDGSIEILKSPSGGVGKVLSSGAGWAAITREIGAYPAPVASAGQVAEGSRGDDAKAIQAALNKLGFGPLDEDGIFGKGSAAALKRFQAAAGLASTGVVDAGTRDRLTLKVQPWPPINQGASGAAVTEVQQKLSALGFAASPDGQYGPGTAKAVAAFQSSRGLPATGELDVVSRGHLIAAQSVSVPPAVAGAEQDDLKQRAHAAASGLPAEVQAKVLPVIDVAISFVGKKEIPKGSNGGPEIDAITANFYAPPRTDRPPWCALAVSHFLYVGLGAKSWKETPLGYRNGHALTFGSWAEKNGRLLDATGPAPTGAIYVRYRAGSGSDAAAARKAGTALWSGDGHTGMVLADLGDKVLTIDGNVSDMCKTTTTPKKDILAYIRWW